MSEMNFDWDDLRLFLAVAREGGLAAAAEITGKSAPTLGRRMLAMEKRLGQELFERLPRGYSLTTKGQTLLQAVMSLEDSIDPLISTGNEKGARRVKISAGTWVTLYLSREIDRLLLDSSIAVQFISADHVLDIAHREAVIGIRNHRPEHVALAGRQVRKIKFAVYAANSKVQTWARVLGTTPSAYWVQNASANGPALEVTNPRTALDMATAGAVKAVLPTFIGDASQGIQKISEDLPELEHMQWLVTHHEDRHLPEVREVIDRLYNILIVEE